MRRPDINPETLNAYVDGELDSSAAAGVARAAAGDASVAAQIATLRELKAAVAAAVPDREIKLKPGGPAPKRIAFAAAAAIALFVVGAFLHLFVLGEDDGVRWANQMQDRHAAWSFSQGGKHAPIVAANNPAGLLPLDLKSARLTFAGHEKFEFRGHTVLRTGYEGTRGCRVSLYVIPAVSALKTATFKPSLRVRHWDIGDQGFVLMARGMATGRFDSLAAAVEKALRSGLELDRETRQQLAHARRTSPPCQA